MNLPKLFLMLIAVGLFSTSCKKYLDKKPDSKMYVPESLEDLQALLDMNAIMNFDVGSSIIELVADNYYIKDERWGVLDPELQGTYIWEDSRKQVTEGWLNPYKIVYTSNVVLENLAKINSQSASSKYKSIEGSALFYRAFSFFYLLQLYAKPYSEKAHEDLGIVLKLSGSVTEQLQRTSVRRCYDQIVEDLKKSISLLPLNSLNIMRPSQTASKALLARVFLAMSDFENASIYAESAIKDKSTILDFNVLTPEATPVLPFFLENQEIIYFSVLQANQLSSASSAITDSTLYHSYDADDLRKVVFFSPSAAGGPGTYRFRGSYYNLVTSTIFYGLTTGELYLILAECYARLGKFHEAMYTLNLLLKKRYKVGTFDGYSATNKEEATEIVLKERRKELIFRGQRWTDIRRLNEEGKNIEIKRVLNGANYLLLPNDLKGVLLIPELEVTRSGIIQNPR